MVVRFNNDIIIIEFEERMMLGLGQGCRNHPMLRSVNILYRTGVRKKFFEKHVNKID
jgi:hypothetical protein